MSIKEQLTTAMRTAMKEGNRLELGVLRAVLGEIQNQEKAGKVAVDFTDEQVISLLNKQVKQRRESAEIYTEVGNSDRAMVETQEADTLAEFLPTQLSQEEVETMVNTQVQVLDATSMRDMGKVVKAVLAEAQGRTDGKTVSTLVKARLR